MKNQLILILSFIITSAFAQTNRFIYEFKYKEDSLNEKVEKANVILDISGNDVQYYENQTIETDSINKNMNGYSTYDFPIAKLKRKLSSDFNKNYYLLDDTYWMFETNDPIVWKLEKETKTKSEWTLQKATTDFGGRKWIAWFTSEVSVSEGPYKFRGLPGLIVEVYDIKDNFHFELIKIEKSKSANPNIVETVFKKKPKEISNKKYNELLLNYYKDPYSNQRGMKEGSWAIQKEDGSFIETIDGLNQITKETQKRIRTKNNPIELDKVVKYPVK